jgi:hypothetical protein
MNQMNFKLWHMAMMDVITPIIPAFLAGIVPFHKNRATKISNKHLTRSNALFFTY